MPVLRHRSSDRLGLMIEHGIEEGENDNNNNYNVVVVTGQPSLSPQKSFNTNHSNNDTTSIQSTMSASNLISKSSQQLLAQSKRPLLSSSSLSLSTINTTTSTNMSSSISFRITAATTTPTTTRTKSPPLPIKSIVSHHIGFIILLGILTLYHIHQSSNSNAFQTYRMLLPSNNIDTSSSSSSSTMSSLLSINVEYIDSKISDNNGDTSSSSTIVDIISIGSITKVEFQNAQEDTFRTHSSVRNFYRITERNDTDTTCYTNLTYAQLQHIKQFCKSKSSPISSTSSLLRKNIYSPKNHTGWMCAQKRPLDGLHIALQQYSKQQHTTTTISIPQYLMIIDDDTYINMNLLLHHLHTNHSEIISEQPQLITGCRYNYPPEEHFLFPYGGFATILSKMVIENLIQPIYCNTTTTGTGSNSDSDSSSNTADIGFMKLACWRLQQNLMGELQYFMEGMSINDLIYIYNKELAFTQGHTWKNGHGFCFHSDHALGYFFGYYHIAVPEHEFVSIALQKKNIFQQYNDTLRHQYGYVSLIGPIDGCKHFKKRCNTQSTICHYQDPQQMRTLFQEQQQQQQQQQQEPLQPTRSEPQ